MIPNPLSLVARVVRVVIQEPPVHLGCRTNDDIDRLLDTGEVTACVCRARYGADADGTHPAVASCPRACGRAHRRAA